jgi:hypothetical protein
METVCFSETLASTDESTRRQNPEEEHYHPRHSENLKSHRPSIMLEVPVFYTVVLWICELELHHPVVSHMPTEINTFTPYTQHCIP